MVAEIRKTADEALNMIKTHVAVCETQNTDILRRLSIQDKILYTICGGVLLEVIHTVFTHASSAGGV